MKILYICPDTGIDVLGRKGGAIHVREMIAAFSRGGHHVDLVAPRLQSASAIAAGEPPATTPARVVHVPVPEPAAAAKADLDAWTERVGHPCSLAKDIRRVLFDEHLVAELNQRYSENPPDVIYVRASLLSTAGAALARQNERPLIVELNAPLAEEQDRYRAGSLRALAAHAEYELLGHADVIVVVSKALRDHVLTNHSVDPARVLVVPNGIDPDRFRPRAQRGPSHPPTLGFVGGLRPWHGAHLLPAVLAGVRRTFTDARLAIVGDGPARTELVDRARELGVEHAIQLTGTIGHDDIAALIGGFDVALAPYPRLPHDFYFSPLKVVEYLACATPVVASATGQIADLFRDREHLRLTEPGNVDAMVAACTELLGDPEGARSMAEAGSALVRSTYTWDRNAKRILDRCFARAG